jgi:DNA-binding FadR family transcriptional regulator
MVSLHFQLAGTTFRELTSAQTLLEPQCAALAAQNRSAQDLSRLEAILASAHDIDPQRGAEWQRESMRFHDQIIEMSKNRAIALFARSLKEVFTDRTLGGGFHPLEFQRINDEHREIADAIRDKDADRAQKLMKEHTEMVAKYFGHRFPGLLDDVVTWR